MYKQHQHFASEGIVLATLRCPPAHANLNAVQSIIGGVAITISSCNNSGNVSRV